MGWMSEVTCFHSRQGKETVPFSKRPVRPWGPSNHVSSACRGFSLRTYNRRAVSGSRINGNTPPLPRKISFLHWNLLSRLAQMASNITTCSRCILLILYLISYVSILMLLKQDCRLVIIYTYKQHSGIHQGSIKIWTGILNDCGLDAADSGQGKWWNRANTLINQRIP